jgi:predicted transcriptional regulator
VLSLRNDLIDILTTLALLMEGIVEIKPEDVFYERMEHGGGLKFRCKMCGREFRTEKSVENHIKGEHHEDVVKLTFKKALSKMGKSPEYTRAFNILIDNMDVKKLEELDVDLTKAEEIARLFNEVFFHGDWEKYIEWIKMYGSEKQQREDIPLLEKLMKEDMKKSR